MSESIAVAVELPKGFDRKWFEQLMKQEPVQLTTDKAYAGRIAECVFDLTYVAYSFIFDGVIPTPEDSRDLYQKLLEMAYEFEDEYDEEKDDYLSKIAAFGEKRILEEFGENEYQKAEKIVKNISRTRIGNPLEHLIDTGYAWWLWKDIKDEEELTAIKKYCFAEQSGSVEYEPKSYPCSVITFSDEDGNGSMVSPESLSCQIESFSKNLGNSMNGVSGKEQPQC